MTIGRGAARWLRGALALWLACYVIAGENRARAGEAADVEQMQRLFKNPPDDARVMMRWWWFGPAVTNAEISRELHAMKDAGIGGVELQSVYPLALDDPAAGIKNLSFLSDEHLAALRYANDEARALGLRVDLTLGSGWPYGGPSVPITQAAGRLRVERVPVREGEDRVHAPELAAGEELLAVFLARANGSAVVPEGTRELPAAPGGTVVLPADRDGASELMFFISSRTGQQVKRAAVGAEGLVLDHYDRVAVEAYLHHVGDRLMQAFGEHPPYAAFCDSLEVYLSDWTPDLLAEFQKRRGYDLKPWLPALAADFGPRTAEIRRDWGATLTELFDERFVQTVRDWAAAHHTQFRFQGYGTPPASLSTSRLADLPEGEGAQWKTLGAVRWAASTSHLYARPITSSETWTWLHSPTFRATPLDLKAEADLHFLQGSNQLVGHGWPYSPPGVEYPGWRFYAAGALNDQNPWWIVAPELMRYLQRASWLLRQGQPANDVAIYLPTDDAWAQFREGRSANLFETLRACIGKEVVAKVLEAGYDLDFFDDEALRLVGKIEPGKLVLGPNKYRAVILPNVERMPLATLRKLADFAKQGGVVIATRRLPEIAAGFQVNDADRKEVADTVQRLFQGAGAPAHLVSDEDKSFAAQLTSLVTPDVAFSAPQADLGFLHRHTDDAEIFFVANTGPLRHEVEATFRVNGARAEWWNPLTGDVSLAAAAQDGTAGTTLPLALEPYESRFVVFTRRGTPLPTQMGSFAAVGANGALRSPSTFGALASAPLDLGAGWQVSFDKAAPIAMEQLHSWADDAATRFYSGRATYEKSFDVPPDYLQKAARLLLDFGPVKALPVETLRNGTRAWIEAPVAEAAVVFLNGERVGSVWHPPYRLDVTTALRPGSNQLKVIVGNTAINHLAGTRLPDYKSLTQRYGERFKPQDMESLQPLPSGLLGPVRLVPASSE